MRNDLADVTVVLDRSGSMSSIRDDAEGGLNQFIEQQKAGVGEAVFTLVQFDTEYEFVHRAVPIRQVPKCTLVPRGSTALLDAVGKAIAETGERLSKMAEHERPGLVVFVVVTDGQENSSREYTKQQIKEMIEHQQTKYCWQFTFLGANQDAFAEAGGLGIAQAAAAVYSPSKSPQAFNAAASSVNRMREQSSSGASVLNRYTDEERKLMAD